MYKLLKFFFICFCLPFYLVYLGLKYLFVPTHSAVENCPRRKFALYLCYPIFHDAHFENLEANNLKSYGINFLDDMRTELKIQFDIPSSYDDEKIKETFEKDALQHWYKWDVEHFRAHDNWRNCMAFACARTSFSLRVAFLLGWISEEVQWQLLMLNASRTQACFYGWEDFATCWAKGREDWLAGSRTDNIGKAFDEKEINNWLKEDIHHPWHTIEWYTDLSETKTETDIEEAIQTHA